MLSIKMKGLPEKNALELTGDEILIIEDKNNTCQIKLSELLAYMKNGLLDKDSFSKILTESLSDVLSRINSLEDIYCLKINNIIKTLPVNLPGKSEEISNSYKENQNNISIELIKKTVNEYELIVTENAELNSYYSGGSIKEGYKWYGVILEFNTNNGFIEYDNTQSSGNWAEMYSVDYSEKTDIYVFNGVDFNTSPEEDIQKTLNSIIVWLRADDDTQTFCFKDHKDNTVKLKITVNKYVPEIIETPEEEIKHTYGVYQWDGILGSRPVISMLDNDVLNISFYGNIKYTPQLINGIHTSGHWVGIDIIPPVGFDISSTQYPKMYSDGALVLEGWNNFFEQDKDGNVIANDITKARWLLSLDDLNRTFLCTIDWGIGYIDTVRVSVENAILLFPPITE